MSPRRVLAFGLGTQCLLIAAAFVGSRMLNIPPSWGSPLRDLAIGVAAALVLAGINYGLLVGARSSWVVDGLRTAYREVLGPLFGKLSTASIVTLSLAAGLGEEWLFRGVVQPAVGLPAASVVFGLAHIGGRRMLPLGVWATGMGVVMGSLAIVTGGLIAPVVAHAIYDVLALEYIRRGAKDE
jgi:membrane protease YdiL (CAAX protease family)